MLDCAAAPQHMNPAIDRKRMSDGVNDPRVPRQPQDPRVPHAEPEAQPQVHQPVRQGYGTPPQDAAPPKPPVLPGSSEPTLITGPRPAPAQPSAQRPSLDSARPPEYAYGNPQSAPTAPVPPLQPPYTQQPFRQAGYNPNEPDWAAMAARNEATTKRRRILLAVAGVVALALVGSGVAYGVGVFGGSTGKSKQPQTLGSPTVRATSSSSPSSIASHHAPLTAGGVLSAQTLNVNGRLYTRKLTDTTSTCTQGTGSSLGALLAKNKCSQLLRATYVAGNSSVTVGIAVFPTQAEATAAAQDQSTGSLAALYAGATGVFCLRVPCATSHAAQGRFTYYTVAGPSDGTAGSSDPASIAATHGFAAYALERIKRLNP